MYDGFEVRGVFSISQKCLITVGTIWYKGTIFN